MVSHEHRAKISIPELIVQVHNTQPSYPPYQIDLGGGAITVLSYVPVPDASTPSPHSSSPSSISTNHLSPIPEDPCTTSKRRTNTCPHCGKHGHFGQDCRTPHIYCADRGYCKLWRKSKCQYPRSYGKEGRYARRRALREVAIPLRNSGYVAETDEPNLNRSVELPV